MGASAARTAMLAQDRNAMSSRVLMHHLLPARRNHTPSITCFRLRCWLPPGVEAPKPTRRSVVPAAVPPAKPALGLSAAQ